MIEPADILRVGRRELGTPFHHQGRCPGVGLDCIGLLVSIATELEIPHQDCTTYPRTPSPDELRAGLRASGLVHVESGIAQPGDVLVFWIRAPGKIQHVGILTDLRGMGILHTYANVGKVVEHGMTRQWLERISEVWRFPGVRVIEEAA